MLSCDRDRNAGERDQNPRTKPGSGWITFFNSAKADLLLCFFFGSIAIVYPHGVKREKKLISHGMHRCIWDVGVLSEAWRKRAFSSGLLGFFFVSLIFHLPLIDAFSASSRGLESEHGLGERLLRAETFFISKLRF